MVINALKGHKDQKTQLGIEITSNKHSLPMNIIMVYKENLSFPGTNPQQRSKFLRTECRQSSCETSPVTGSDEMQLYFQVSESLSKQGTILLDSLLSSRKHKNRRNGPHKF